ncbi:hypothetical protein SLS63_008027 [Diaporthe eres]|uniref:Uncharacterized protein n=1 Tax=Diaporthe eres TaxID=83184 RepID=A0ABR1P3R7_DIAER
MGVYTPVSELVVDNPPLETAPSQAETTQLTINTPISVGSANGAQVVTCSITPDGESAGPSFQAVAKIYDPLYYSFKEWIAHAPRNVVTEADKDYSREAAAICGSLIENDPEGEGKDAYHYPEEYRLEVLALAMDGYVRQLHSGIDQLDFADRNVMLVPRGPSAEPGQNVPVVAGLPLPRVVLVDYNAAIVYTQSNRGRPTHMDWPHPCNPMWYFWDESMDDFGGWVPDKWHHNPKFMQEWL